MSARVQVLHGVNFDVLGRRPAAHYGGLTLEALEVQVKRYAADMGLSVTFSQTNHEGEYCEALHNSTGDGLILNPGAWTHYSWAIRDALELTDLPAVEVHLSAVDEREEWRRTSVIRDLCIAVVAGRGVEGYRDALALLAERLGAMSRADRLVELLHERELDALLVTNLVHVRYLTGFTGTNGACIVARDERLFLTDSRYTEQAREQVRDFELLEASRELLGDLAARLRGRAGFDDAQVSVRAHRLLAERAPDAVELVPAAGLVERLRAVKEEAELRSMRAAAELADAAYERLRERGLAGRTEREVARWLVRFIEDAGADSVSFPPIVAAGAHGALPHAEPRDVLIPRDTLVVVDLGARVDGYCSDCTRTLATGPLDERALAAYEAVRRAQQAALDEVRAGAVCREVDEHARTAVERELGVGFDHGLGHGVGLEVHEAPRLARTAEGALEAGNVVTVEPGVYLPGEFGIRIEDLVVVGADGCEAMTGFPKELVTIE